MRIHRKIKSIVKILLIGICIFIGSVPSFGKTRYVAEVNGKKYTSVQEAADHLKSGQTLELLKDIKTTETLIIDVGKKKKAKFDFAGKKYYYTGSSSAIVVKSGNITVEKMYLRSKEGNFGIEKNASLILKGGSCSGLLFNQGNCTITGGSYKKFTAYNVHKLIIRGGTFRGADGKIVILSENGGDSVISGGTFRARKNGNAVVARNTGSVTIKGGIFSSEESICLVSTKGDILLKGGTFYSTKNTAVVNNNGTLRIKKATVKNKSANYPIYNNGGAMTIEGINLQGGLVNETSDRKKLLIKGGKISGEVWNKGGTMEIRGGSFVSSTNVLYNEANLKVSGGSFLQKGGKKAKNQYALLNYGKAVLTGGTFKKSGSKEAAIGNRKGYSVKMKGNVTGKVTTLYTILDYTM